MAANEHMTESSISFDLQGELIPKIYIYPVAKSLATGEHLAELVSLVVNTAGINVSAALEVLQDFITGVSDPNADLPPSEHRTAGIIFNFELRHGEAWPKPKVYVPVRHYGGNDMRIAEGLNSFFMWCGWKQLAGSYPRKIQTVL